MILNRPAWKKQLEKAQYPIKVSFYFYRDSKRRFDYINVTQIIADLMQKYNYIEDDDASHFIPVFEGYEVTAKSKSGFIMRII